MVMRKKILSGNVPIEELKDMRLQLAKKIDLGNQLIFQNSFKKLQIINLYAL